MAEKMKKNAAKKTAKKEKKIGAGKITKTTVKSSREEEKQGGEMNDEDGAASRNPKGLSLLRGMKDILPKEEVYWQRAMRAAEDIARAYGFGYIAPPIVEDAGLFIRSVGKGTDVVEKEMYVFEDRDGKKVCLRPELTASVARAYIDHGMHSLPQPVKVWYQGPMFRHDRPQAGRYRQFHQFDCEVIGERDPEIDAELIAVAYNYIRDLGISTQVHMNSIGSVEDRERYIVELVGYLRSKRSYLSEESKKRLLKNPLRVLDSKEEEDKAIIEEAPQIIDWLSDESRKYFMKVLEYLDELEIPYILQPTLVRGLDYYTDTVFEIYADSDEIGRQNALGGGGRYDRLIEQLGGRPTPACGFALGQERIISAMRKMNEGKEQPMTIVSPIFFAHLGEQARRRALLLVETMRRAGLLVHHNLAKASLKAQLELANRFRSTYTLILGQKEMQDNTIIIRDMASGIQEIIDQKNLLPEVKKLFSGTKTK